MYLKAILSSLLLSCILTGAAGAKKGGGGNCGDWGYNGDIGPDHWDDICKTCGGKKQSPIDIDTDDVVEDKKLE
ncbi:carbonic anhydrase family protein, partial [Staphylococcus aureus]|uniref:carbonic anhydrase family protein n=1 Tax=Staphylococcus aureus TaxID=1280 RepID=UPI0038B23536